MFERIEYMVERCVARALLPEDVSEGTRLAYEMFQYSIIN